MDAELAAPAALDGVAGVYDLVTEGLRVRCQVDHAAWTRCWAACTAGVRALTCRPPTLEELFLRHYSAERTVAEAPR